MDTTVVVLLIILILAVVIFGFNSLRSNSDNISGAAVAPQSLPSQYGGGACGR